MFFKPYLKGKYKIYFLILLFFVFNITFGGSSGNPTITVKNMTKYYLHVKIVDKSFAYIKPGAGISSNSDVHSALVTVHYSPGEPLTGVGTKTFSMLNSDSLNCDNSSGGCKCFTNPGIYNNDGLWEVYPEDLN